MIATVRIYINEVLDTWKETGFVSVLEKAFFINKEIVPVVKDLFSVHPFTSRTENEDVRFVEIGNGDEPSFPFFRCKSRHLKMLRNLEKGYRGFALMKGDEVIGDIWYFYPGSSCRSEIHPDQKWLDIRLGEKEVYMFDLYVRPEERGRGLVNLLFKSALYALKKKGFTKVYGFYMASNIPAMWTHRICGYKELHRFKLLRFFFIRSRSWRKVTIGF